jgi:hypothetical protein
MSDKRITEEEMVRVLLIAGVDKITDSKVTRSQAEEIARVLDEPDRLHELLMRNRGDMFDLNCLLNSLRFYRISDIYQKEHISNDLRANDSWARHAKNIATETLNNAVTEEDRARGQREMNAANALGRGDIDGAFRSLNYFQDR